MPRTRPRSALTRGLLTFLAVLVATFLIATLTSGAVEASPPPGDSMPAAAAATGAGAQPVDSPPATGAPAATENVFMPERENVSDCFGGVERPNCGSKAKGGWRQGLVFGVIAASMALIGWRLVVAVRRRDRTINAG